MNQITNAIKLLSENDILNVCGGYDPGPDWHFIDGEWVYDPIVHGWPSGPQRTGDD